MNFDGQPPTESKILEQLRDVGVDAPSLSALRTSGRRYRSAIPILSAALERVTDQKLLGEIVRALSVPWASAALPQLIKIFREVPDSTGLGPRWTVGNAIEVLWDDAHFPELAAMVEDRDFGRAREMLALGLAKSRHPEAANLLVRLLDDLEVRGHAIKAMRRRGPIPRNAAQALERAAMDDRAWVRKEASRALQERET